jgi:hypothetical protein
MRTEFIIIFVWKEWIPSDSLIQKPPDAAAPTESATK